MIHELAFPKHKPVIIFSPGNRSSCHRHGRNHSRQWIYFLQELTNKDKKTDREPTAKLSEIPPSEYARQANWLNVIYTKLGCFAKQWNNFTPKNSKKFSSLWGTLYYVFSSDVASFLLLKYCFFSGILDTSFFAIFRPGLILLQKCWDSRATGSTCRTAPQCTRSALTSDKRAPSTANITAASKSYGCFVVAFFCEKMSKFLEKLSGDRSVSRVRWQVIECRAYVTVSWEEQILGGILLQLNCNLTAPDLLKVNIEWTSFLETWLQNEFNIAFYFWVSGRSKASSSFLWPGNCHLSPILADFSLWAGVFF